MKIDMSDFGTFLLVWNVTIAAIGALPLAYSLREAWRHVNLPRNW